MGWAEMVLPGHFGCPWMCPSSIPRAQPWDASAFGAFSPLSPTPGIASALPGGEFRESSIYPSPEGKVSATARGNGRGQSGRGWDEPGAPGAPGAPRLGRRSCCPAGIDPLVPPELPEPFPSSPRSRFPAPSSSLAPVPPSLHGPGSGRAPRDQICRKNWDLGFFNSWAQVWGCFPAHPLRLQGNPGRRSSGGSGRGWIFPAGSTGDGFEGFWEAGLSPT